MPRVTATWAWHSGNKGSLPRLCSAWSAATSWARDARTGAIRRPSGCENAAGSSSSMAGWPPSYGVRPNPRMLAMRNEYAQLCYEKKCYAAAARLFSEGLIADPKPADGLELGQRDAAAWSQRPWRAAGGGRTQVNWTTRNWPAGESRLLTGCGST